MRRPEVKRQAERVLRKWRGGSTGRRTCRRCRRQSLRSGSSRRSGRHRLWAPVFCPELLSTVQALHNQSMTRQNLTIRITDRQSQDPDRLDALVLAMRRELLDIHGVHAAQTPQAAPGERTKSGTVEIIGCLVIAISATRPILTELRLFFHDWLRRNDGTCVHFEHEGQNIDLMGLPTETIEKLLVKRQDDDRD